MSARLTCAESDRARTAKVLSLNDIENIAPFHFNKVRELVEQRLKLKNRALGRWIPLGESWAFQEMISNG